MTDLSSPIEYLRKLAKTLTKQVRDADPIAIARVRAVFFDLAEKTDVDVRSALSLMRAQHVVAVEHGFPKWNDLIDRSQIELHLAITMVKEPALNDFGIGLFFGH